MSDNMNPKYNPENGFALRYPFEKQLISFGTLHMVVAMGIVAVFEAPFDKKEDEIEPMARYAGIGDPSPQR
ncbi:hypothetical protein [Oceanibaculum nanhaiense]|uniref:hypothetical protein n=1 Tax=Oceanibaculum nanhaiense TaxID=1909734 RepID=UPI00396EDC22